MKVNLFVFFKILYYKKIIRLKVCIYFYSLVQIFFKQHLLSDFKYGINI